MEKFWIHPEGYLYSGDKTDGAREAIQEEIESHLNPAPTPEQIQKTLTDTVQTYLDSKVNERGYDSILAACSYADDINPKFSAEGLACKKWRSAVWQACYDILGEVMAALREIPTAEELLAELPELIWPE